MPRAWSTPARTSPPTSPLDDLFVAGATFHEPTAAARHTAADRARSAARRRRLRSMAGRARTPLLALAVLGLAAASAHTGGASRPRMPDRLQLVVGVVDVQPDPQVVSRVERDARVAVAWLEEQVGGRLGGTPAVASLVHLPLGDITQLPADDATGRALEAHRRLQVDHRILPVIVLDVETAPLQDGTMPCGMGGPVGIVVFLGNCPSAPPSWLSSEDQGLGRGLRRTIAHELVHAMGAVADCAPNRGDRGHVTDHPDDLMYRGAEPSTGEPILDVGNDDYWGHDIAGCSDIVDSPLWRW